MTASKPTPLTAAQRAALKRALEQTGWFSVQQIAALMRKTIEELGGNEADVMTAIDEDDR